MSNSAHGLGPDERKDLENLIASLEGQGAPQQPAAQQPAPAPQVPQQQVPPPPAPPAGVQPGPAPFTPPASPQPTPPPAPEGQVPPAAAPQPPFAPAAPAEQAPAQDPFAAPPAPETAPAVPEPQAPQPQVPPVSAEPAFAPPAPEPPFAPPASAPAQPASAPLEQGESAPFAPPAPEGQVTAAAPEPPFTAPAEQDPAQDPFAAPAPPAPEPQMPQPQVSPTPAPGPAPEPAPAPVPDAAEAYVPAYSQFDGPAGQQQAPQTPAAPSQEEYVPAHEQLERQQQEEMRARSTLEGFEPADILVAIAVNDSPESSEQADADTLREMVEQANQAEQQGRKRRGGKVKLGALPFNEIPTGTPVIGTFYSPSGGVGKSSQAMNLAVLIAAIGQAMAAKKRERGAQDVRIPRVLLIDGDVVHGSLAMRLRGKLKPSMHDLLLYVEDREDAGFTGENAWPTVYDNAPPGEKAMRDFVLWHKQVPNMNVLAAPDVPDLFYDFGPQEYRNMLRMLARFYDVILIDAGTDIVLESQRAWLAHAHQVFLVTSPEIDRLFNAAKVARHMAKALPHPADTREDAPVLPPLVTAEKLSVVVTRADADSGLNLDVLMRERLFPWLEKSQDFRIPDYSAEMLKANNQGKFLVLQDGDYAKVMLRMARQLFNAFLAQTQKRALPEAQPPQAPPAQ